MITNNRVFRSGDSGATRLPYAACRGEGQNACVIGPNEEIVVEVTDDSGPEEQMRLASHIALGLNRRLYPRDEVDSMDEDILRDKYRHLKAQVDALATCILDLGVRGTEDAGAIAVAIERLKDAYCGDGVDHCCSAEGRKLRAGYLLALIADNVVNDVHAMRFLEDAVDCASVSFVRRLVERGSGGAVPF